MKDIQYKNINVSELKEMMSVKDFLLIDVKIPEQVHIPGTDYFLPFDKIHLTIEQLGIDKSKKIVLYCRSGYTSSIAAEKLSEIGYANVSNLLGGVIAWRQSGGLVEDF